MKKIKPFLIIVNILIAFAVSVAIFSATDISYILFSVIFIATELIILLKFRKNRKKIYASTVILSISIVSGFCLAKYINCRDIAVILNSIDTIDIALTAVSTLLLVILIVLGIYGGNKKESRSSDELLEQQKYDIERVIEYINNFNIIGINGAWGSGKTFICDYIERETKSNYIYLNIDLLSCNLDKIQSVIFDSLSRLLSSNGIYSKNSKSIQDILSYSNNIFKAGVSSFLDLNTVSYTEALNGLKSDLAYLGKTIVIVYEDIDRITDKDTIKTIFSISEQLVCNNIKVMYQFDQEHFEQIGLNRDYVEKYIPYIINLTDIDFLTVAKHLIDKHYKNNTVIDIKDMSFIELPKYFKLGVAEREVYIKINVSIRKVKFFLEELICTLEMNPEYQSDNYKKVVIVFYIIKHFAFDIYKDICVSESPLDSLKLAYKNELYPIREISVKANSDDFDFENLFSIRKNVDILAFSAYMGYDLNIFKNKESKGFPLFDDIYCKETKDESLHELNEKIDRLIWNLVCNGKSEYTDRENAVKLFSDKVLGLEKTKQKVAAEKFFEDMYNQNLYKNDNRTIFKIGTNNYYELFRSFYIVGTTKDNWHKLIEFYFNTIEKSINPILIATLNHCNIDYNSVYVSILKHFNTFTITGNMNSQKAYKYFLRKYLGQLYCYIDTYYLETFRYMLDTEEPICEDFVTRYLEPLKKKVQDEIANCKIERIKEDLNVIENFIEKNIELISNDEVCKPLWPPMKIDTHISCKHSDDYNRLLSIKDSDDYFNEIEKSYMADLITAKEAITLVNDQN